MEYSISIDLNLEENVFSSLSSSSSLDPNSENEGNITHVSSTNSENETYINDLSSTNGENQGDISDVSSTNSKNGLLQDLDSSSDELQPVENETVPPPDDGDDENGNLSIDLDNLGNDIRTPVEMFEILNNDPEWTQNFMPNHVKQFSGDVGHKLREKILTHQL